MDKSSFRFVTIHAFDTNRETDRRTDRWTDGIPIARPRLHSMQCGKISQEVPYFDISANSQLKVIQSILLDIIC